MGCASLNFWDSLCLHAALLGNPSMEPCGDHEGTPSCLRVPLPHVSLPKTLRRIRFFAGGQWGGGSWLQSCVFSPSLEFLPLLVPCPSRGNWHRAALGMWHECCRSWAMLQQCLSFPLYPMADPVLSTAILQTDVWFCRGDFEAILLAAKHSTNCLQLPHPLQPPVSSPQSSRRDVCSYPQWMCSSCGMQCCPTHRSPHFLCSSCSG